MRTQALRRNANTVIRIIDFDQFHRPLQWRLQLPFDALMPSGNAGSLVLPRSSPNAATGFKL
jgi:hypothetical protein